MMRAWVAALLVVVSVAGCLGGGKDGPDPPAVTATETAAPPPAAPPEPAPLYPHYPSDGAAEVTTLEIPSFDGHLIPLTVYRPKVATPETPVPIVLHSHGFTNRRATAPDAFQPLVAAGFGVISFDERGHGDARDDSSLYFMHPEVEVRDVQKVVDHAASLDWVLMEDASTAAGPGDPLMGAIGYSYGGAFQLMGAIFDPRFDALVPEITWNDIVESLGPSGAIKSGWVGLFYAAGNAQQSVRFSDDFHAGFAWAMGTNTFPAGQAPGVPDLYTRLKESSPASYPGRLTVPTLLVQGMPDTLFPLNEAVANLRLLEAAGVPDDATGLYTHLGGHVLSANSLRANTTPVPVGLQGQPGGRPCGAMVDLQVAWLSRHLLQLPVDTGPRVCIALEDGSTLVGPTFPLPGTDLRPFELGGPVPVAQAPAGPSIHLPLLTAEEDTLVAGIPQLNGTITVGGADAIVYFSLKVPSRGDPFEAIVDDQVVPLRVQGPAVAQPFSLDLGGVGVLLRAGEELVLAVSTVEPMYFANAERLPGGAVLDQLVLRLPIVPPGTPSLPAPPS